MKFLSAIPFARMFSIGWPLAGIALVGFGAYQVYPPAACITIGVLILFDTIHATRGRRK